MWKNKLGIVGLLIMGLIACSPSAPSPLLGQWQAVDLSINDQIVNLDLSKVSMRFAEDQRYVFKGTLNYQEAGRFREEGPYIYTTDTIHSGQEKAVKKLLLTSDSLHIEMKNEGQKMVFRLVKE